MSKTKKALKMIPMRELEKLTNLSRATITFYVKEGLLPVPEKSAKNMAYYDEAFIEKLKFIEKMRNADFTLSQIKKLISYDANTVSDFGMQIMESVNRLMPMGIDESPVTIGQLKDIGFNDGEMEILIKMRIVNPLNAEKTEFLAYSLTVCRFVRYFLDFGIPITAAQEIMMKIKELTVLEKNIFIKYIRSPMLDNNVSREEQKKEIQRCIESINGLLPILHLQYLKLSNEDLQKTEDTAEPYASAGDKKREAEARRKEAGEKEKEAEEQRKEAEEKEKEAEEQRKEAEEKEKEAEARRKEAEEQKKKAEAKKKEATEQKIKAEAKKKEAAELKKKAEEKKKEAEEQKKEADEIKKEAEEQKKEAEAREKEARRKRRREG